MAHEYDNDDPGGCSCSIDGIGCLLLIVLVALLLRACLS